MRPVPQAGQRPRSPLPMAFHTSRLFCTVFGNGLLRDGPPQPRSNSVRSMDGLGKVCWKTATAASGPSFETLKPCNPSFPQSDRMDNLWKLRSYRNLPSKLIWLAYSGSTRLDDDLPAFFWSVGFSSDGMLHAPNDNAITASSEAKTRRISTSLDCCRTNDVLSVQPKYILQAATPARRRRFAARRTFRLRWADYGTMSLVLLT